MNENSPEDGVLRTAALDIESLPLGEVSLLRVQLMEDGLSRPLRVPVLVVRGRRPGPVFGVTAAVHGEELNGIFAIHRLVDRIDPAKLRGTLVCVAVVNVPGLLAHRRGFNARYDLNHMFPGDPGGHAASLHAHRLMDRIVRHFDFLVDLHTASSGSINSLYVRADMTDPTTAKMAYLQRPEIILHDQAADQTLRGAAMAEGIPAITVEIGDPRLYQANYVAAAYIGIRSVMHMAGMVAARPVAPGLPPVVCSRSRWLFTDRGGLLEVTVGLREQVVKGQDVACLRDVFGRTLSMYHAPEDAIVIGCSTDPVGSSGSRVVHFGMLATERDHVIHRDDATP